MGEVTYTSEQDCRAFLAERLRLEDLPNDIAENLAARLARTCEQQAAPRLGLGYRVRSWVIRQEDVGFFGVLRTGVLVAMAAATGAAVGAPIVGAIAAAAETGWNAWRKGARLEPRDVRVLIQLEQAAAPLTPAAIGELISTPTEAWSADDVEAILKRLAKLPTRSGAIAIVHETSDGWRSTH